MRNVFLVGVARSGIGAVASALARAGAYTGSRRGRPPASEPFALAPSRGLAEIGEAQLAPVTPPEALLLEGRRWLAVPPEGAPLARSPEITAALRAELRPPFALADPRLVWTLPAWIEEAPDAGRVCVVRHPARAATSLVRAAAEGREPCEPELDLAGAFALWTAAYRRVLEHAREGDWLFCELESLAGEPARARLAAFTRAEIGRDAFRPELARPVPDIDVPEEALALWRTLSARCEADGCTTVDGPAELGRAERRVAAVCVIEDRTRAHAASFLDRCARQRGVRVEPVLVDATLEGDLGAELARTGTTDGLTVVHEPRPGFGPAAHAALAATDAEWIAWCSPESEEAPHRLAVQLAAAEREGAELVTCDLAVADGEGRLARTVGLAPWDDAPPADWTAGLFARREALAGVRATSFAPTALERLRTARRHGRVAHLAEPLVAVPEAHHAAAVARGREDARWLDLSARPHSGEPEISVLLATYRRREVLLECLESFSRQLLPPGTFEIVCVDDGSEDGTTELARSLELPVPFVFARQPNAGPARARNTGLELVRAPLVLFVNDDTIAAPDLVRQHLEAHRTAGGSVAFLGAFVQPPAERRIALTDLLETSAFVFGYAEFDGAGEIEPQHFYTCNASAPTAVVREVGGFDEGFDRPAGEDTDLGLRLAQHGLRLCFLPQARAVHRHRIDLDDLRRRQLMVADAHAHLYAKHPDIVPEGAFRITRPEQRRVLEEAGPYLPALQEAVRTLGALDLEAITAAPGPRREECRRLAESMRRSLADGVSRLHNLWWTEGLLGGIERRGGTSIAEWIARADASTGERTVLFADARERPSWPGAIERWVARVGAGANDLGERLIVVVPPEGPPLGRVRDAVAGILLRAAEAGVEADVRVEAARCGGQALTRYLAGSRWIPAGGEWDAALDELARSVGARTLDLGKGAADEPWLLSTAAAVRLLAHPRWNEAGELCALARAAARIAGTSTCLVLRHDPARDGELEAAVAALQHALSAVLSPGVQPELLVEPAPADETVDARLARACDAFLRISAGDEPPAAFPPRRVITTEDLAERLTARLAEVRALSTNTLPAEACHA